MTELIRVNAENMEVVIDMLTERRKSLGMNQQTVADWIGTTRSGICDFEKNRYKSPTLAKILRYADAVDVDLVVGLSEKRRGPEQLWSAIARRRDQGPR